MVHLIDKAVYDFEIGDLVRLSEDVKIEVGYGLVADVKTVSYTHLTLPTKA